MKDIIDPMDSAACAHPAVDPNIFWEPSRETEALAVCRTCPVRQHCLALGMKNDRELGTFGVWAGMTEKQRRIVAYREEQARTQAATA